MILKYLLKITQLGNSDSKKPADNTGYAAASWQGGLNIPMLAARQFASALPT